MASRILVNKSRNVAYMNGGFKTLVRQFRQFSSYSEGRVTVHIITESATNTDSSTVWPDAKWGPLGVKDRRFPLPGNVGTNLLMCETEPVHQQPHREPDLLAEELPHERQINVLSQFNNLVKEEVMLEESLGPTPTDNLECVAQVCPDLLRKDFMSLFPHRDVTHGILTVITVSHKTENDMSGWSPEVEEEREELLAQFMVSAEEICNALHGGGFWADFIDPTSGRPYLGPHTNATLFETDERYRHFGFEINDMGCCKVISHKVWGTHAYVGCLFTDAPYDHPIIVAMTRKETSHSERATVS